MLNSAELVCDAKECLEHFRIEVPKRFFGHDGEYLVFRVRVCRDV